MTMPPFITSTRRRAGALLAACALAPAGLRRRRRRAAPPSHHGDRGRSVESLQRALHIGADGVFGRGTVRAVKRFQRRHGLHADGVVGAGDVAHDPPQPAPPPHASPARRRVARRDGPRPSVSLLQRQPRRRRRRRLRPGHVRAVKRFQRGHGLTADGVVGPGDVDRARRSAARTPCSSARACAAAAARRRRRHPGRGRARDRRGEPDRRPALPLRRRPPLVLRQRLRLLGVGLLRPARRRARSAARSTPSALMSYGVARARAAGSRSTRTPATPTWSSAAAATTRPGAVRAGSRWQHDERSTAGYTVRHPPGL